MSSQPTTTTQTSGPPAPVLQAYGQLNTAASNLSQQPLNLYQGNMVAGFTPQQQAGFTTINNAQGLGAPYLNAAAQEFGAATTPIWNTLPQFSASTVNQYMSPYTQDVTGSLTNLFNQQNAEQLQQIQGNATTAGAYGGDREAVEQALTAGQQQLSEAPTLAQVEQQGYTAGLGAFQQQQQTQMSAEEANAWLASQAGVGMGQLGTEAQQLALQGAQAQLGAGGMQQQLAQEMLNIPYQQFLQTQAYPYQQLGFLAPITEGTGSLSGGTGTTSYPGPSTLSQVAGLGLTGAGIAGLGSQQGWWGGSSGNIDVGGSTPGSLAGPWVGYGTTEPVKSGGRITNSVSFEDHHRRAMGGMIGGMPQIPGIGAGPPMGMPSYIPEGIGGAGASKSELSPFQPVVDTTQSGGGGGLLGILNPILGIAKLGLSIAGLNKGGRIGYDDGGSIGNTGTLSSFGIAQSASPQATGLPPIPKINLDYIISPGPAIKGSGPPKPPNPPPSATENQGFGPQQAMNLLGEGKSVLKMFGNDSGSSSTSSKKGGRIGLQIGGEAGFGSSVPVTAAIAFGGAPPGMTQQYQQLLQQPVERLQEMAAQFPPTSPQGQMVQRALTQKRDMPMNPVAQAQPSGIGSATAPTNVIPSQQAQPAATASIGMQPDQFGGTSHSMAGGGSVPSEPTSGFLNGETYGLPDEVINSILSKPSYSESDNPRNIPQSVLDAFGAESQAKNESAAGLGRDSALSDQTWRNYFSNQESPTYPKIDTFEKAVDMPQGSYRGGGSADEERGYVTEDELDPHPIVDHSGDTIKIRYPSEGKVLDLGIPSMKKRGHFVAGGAAGSAASMGLPEVAWSGTPGSAGWSVAGTPVNPAPAPGLGASAPSGASTIAQQPTAFSTAPGLGGAFFTAPNNVNIPLQTTTASPFGSIYQGNPIVNPSMGYQPGGGLGNWFQPLSTPYSAVGAGPNGPGGTMTFPSAIAFTPNMGAVISGLNPSATIPQWAGGPPPAAPSLSNSGNNGSGSGIGAIPNPSLDASLISPSSGGGKRGGRIGYARGGHIGYDLGGGVGSVDDANISTDQPVASADIPPPLPPGVVASTPLPRLLQPLIIPPTDDTGSTPPSQTTPTVSSSSKDTPKPDNIGPPTDLTGNSKSKAPSAPADNPAALVRRYESEGDAARVGLSPYVIGYDGTDLSKVPQDKFGFPQWEGRQGPAGTTHAAGAYQFEPATWARYAEPLGIHDFSPQSQDAVFNAAYKDQGFAPWAPYNAKLAAAIGGANANNGADTVIGAHPINAGVTQASYQGNTERQPQQDYKETLNHIIEDISNRAKTGNDIYSSPWLPVLAAGLGMLSGRSPYAAVNIGQGGLDGLKALESQQANLPKMQKEQAEADLARIGTAMIPLRQQAAASIVGDNTAPMTAGSVGTSATASPIISAPLPPIPTAAGSGSNGATNSMVSTGQSAVLATIPSPQSGLPLPMNYGQGQPGSTEAEFDKRYAQMDAQIAQMDRAMKAQAAAGNLDEVTKLTDQKAHLIEARINAGANDPRIAGPKAAAEAEARFQHEGHDIRAGGYLLHGTQPVFAAPVLQKMEPTNGPAYYEYVTPPMPGQQSGNALPQQQLSPAANGALAPAAGQQSATTPTGLPSNAVGPAGINPLYEGAVKDQIAQDRNTIEKEIQPSAQKANATISTAREIMNLMETVPTGMGADWKVQASRALSALNTLGGGNLISDTSVAGMNAAQGQEAQKLFLQISAGAVRNMGAREPGSVIALFRDAYPNLATEPNAVRLMTNILYMQAQRDQVQNAMAQQQHQQAVSNLASGKPYEPLGPVMSSFDTQGPYKVENYLRAAQAMAGGDDSKLAWRGLTKPEADNIAHLIPHGLQYTLPNGQLHIN